MDGEQKTIVTCLAFVVGGIVAIVALVYAAAIFEPADPYQKVQVCHDEIVTLPQTPGQDTVLR